MKRICALSFSFFSLLIAACHGGTPEPLSPASEQPAQPRQPEQPPANQTPTAMPSATPEAPPPTQEQKGAACVGQIDMPPAELEASADPPPSFAIGAPGKGALCEGKVFTVKAPVTVYRLFSASYATSKRAGPLGAYWTLVKPAGTAAAFREAYAICAEWNDLDRLNECKIDVGAQVIIGPGQSAACDGGKEFARSAANQVLVVKKDGKVPVSGCKESPMSWSK